MPPRRRTLMGKTRPVGDPYMVFEAGDWTWKVLKSWQYDDAKQYARWFCAVSSPMTYGGYDLGDTYVADVVQHAAMSYIDPALLTAGYDPRMLARAIASGF